MNIHPFPNERFSDGPEQASENGVLKFSFEFHPFLPGAILLTNSYRWVSLNTNIQVTAWRSTLRILLFYALWKRANFIKLDILSNKHKLKGG